jgi:citrate lyase subunit beta / citryl-CoA lyase
VTDHPVWRSLQYVPAHVEKYVSSAHTRGADAIILDLEDSVPVDQKAAARSAITGAAAQCAQGGADIIVRINRPDDLAAEDIAAAVGPAVAALSLPKVESVGHLLHLDAQVSAVEARLGMRHGHTRFWVLIESAAGFLDMAAIARGSPRVIAMTLGGEDFAADVGMEPSEDTLMLPKQQMIIAAAAAGVMPLGVIGGTTRFDDPQGYLAMAQRSRRFGFVGSSCIHPSQIPLLNQAFSPSAEEVAWAERVIVGDAEAQAAGRAAFSLDGKMIDIPIVGRARALLARHQAILNRRIKQQMV